MALNFQPLSSEYKAPSPVSDDSYELYSAETKTIPQGESVWVGLGYALGIPPGLHGRISSGPLAASHNIETSTFASIHNPTYKFATGETKATATTVLLRNLGKNDYLLKSGTVVARLTLSPVRVLAVREVKDINARDNPETNKIQFEKPKIKALPKTARFWFQRLYKENQAGTIAKYLNTTLLTELTGYRETPEYEEVMNKQIAEVSFLWKRMSKELKARIQADFAKLQSAAYNTAEDQAEETNIDNVSDDE